MSTKRDAVAKNAQGARLLNRGDIEGAAQAFSEAMALNPKLASAKSNREEALRRLRIHPCPSVDSG